MRNEIEWSSKMFSDEERTVRIGDYLVHMANRKRKN